MATYNLDSMNVITHGIFIENQFRHRDENLDECKSA